MCSGHSSHVPSEPALFPLPTGPRGLLRRGRNPQLDFLECASFFGKLFFASPPAYTLLENTQFMEGPTCGKCSCAGKYRTIVVEISDRDNDPITPPRLLRSSSARNSFNIMEVRRGGNISKIMGQTNKDFKSRKFTLTNSLLHKRFRVREMRFQTEV